MQDNEEIPSGPSTPATPGTPGAPLFGGFRSERNHNNGIINGIVRKSLLKSCKFVSVQDWTLEDGALPKVSCSLPPPPIPLARKKSEEPEDKWVRESDWMCCHYWPCCYGHNPLHWPHLRCSSQPCCYHFLCCIEALPLEKCN